MLLKICDIYHLYPTWLVLCSLLLSLQEHHFFPTPRAIYILGWFEKFCFFFMLAKAQLLWIQIEKAAIVIKSKLMVNPNRLV